MTGIPGRSSTRARPLLLWRVAAAALVIVPFVPTITWYSGSWLDPTSESITFATALLMHLSHEHDHMEGMALFALPSLAAAISFLAPIERDRARRALGVATLAIGAWELFLVLVRAHGYGTPYYVVAQWFGIQAMIPEDNYLVHASTLALAGAAMVVIELAIRPRASA